MAGRVGLSVAAFVIAALVGLTTPSPSLAQPHGPGGYRGAPYGSYCVDHGWGPYGARKPVRSIEEARSLIEKFFADNGETITVGRIEAKRRFFEVEILDRDGKLLDRAIVDRRTGRIRSIY